ncbi:spore germination lipoprotein GerD [Alkalibacillus haloalkaliphilus]|uniref:spore germination lipoprotein GerD n=1 Tax=Alkalibacillus haloalkaliphilus TaxID=94136 RepID=UPI002935DD05|nr:spore germination lipoprotein GerD [Alkalibacillus haloalkaliphilus]MDV2582606.1 spore germination lipoprotein GerD [Alkalibacillus haloalkaliphilus]
MAKHTLLLVLTICIFLTACNGDDQQSSPDYEATKRMVVDILKTDDGKEALKEALSDEELEQKLVLQSDTVNQAIEQTISSEEGKEFWINLFDDPSFVQAYIQATREHDKEIIKGLMSDSNYQDQMISLFHEDEVREMIMQILRSQEYKEHLEQSIQETLQSPLFRAQMVEELLKAAQEMEGSNGGATDEQDSNQESTNGSEEETEGESMEGEGENLLE